ncbi:MAG: sugar ABC transporter ATP-binding protein, partial [Planctomycetes bacterium]|nr:sugar ABC transporter ATP-binding protein [Planctomycetota bacterium]
GRVHALLGKNGAGKSTLVKILSGAEAPTSGRITLDGRELKFDSAEDAFKAGIATVYQEMSLVPGLPVGDNILLGRMPRKFGGTMIDWRQAFQQAEELGKAAGMKVDVRQPVAQLGVAQQQMVEIVKAMSFNPSVLMLDEPTSALARHETEMLFRMVKTLAAQGVAIIYITHRLQELKQVADDVTVLRDGKLVGVVDMADASPEHIVHMMFGATERRRRPASLDHGREPVLEVKNLSQAGKFSNITFTLHRGEVLGIAGLLGSGRTELLRSLFGAEPWDSGEMILSGKQVQPGEPADMKKLGLALTPEDRKQQGLVLGLSVYQNLAMASLDKHSRRGVMNARLERGEVDSLIKRLQIMVAGPHAPTSSLSGGNQQKVVVGKWIATNPKVFLFDEPTRGIDVMAKQQIFQMMWDLAAAGASCLFVSTELEELAEVCHRVLIMKNGMIEGEVGTDSLEGEELYVKCMS